MNIKKTAALQKYGQITYDFVFKKLHNFSIIYI